MTVLIRPATQADLPEVRAVHHDSIRRVCSAVYGPAAVEEWTGLLTPERYQTMLSERIMLVAVIGDGVVGFGAMTPEDSLVNAVYVAPEVLGRGVGSALLASLEAAARQAGLTSLRLESTIGAVPFYERCGWVRGADTFSEFPTGLKLPSVEMSRAVPSGRT